jgi:ribosomal protein L37E
MKKIYMEQCPKCKRENHSMLVSTGRCAWCGYKATKKDINKTTIWIGESWKPTK